MVEPKKVRKIRANQKMYEKLKLKVKHPEKLAYEDINNPNLYLINRLKSIPNTISVPQNWQFPKRNLVKNKSFSAQLFDCGDLLDNKFEKKEFRAQIGVLSDELKCALNVNVGDKLPWADKLKYFGLPKIFTNSKFSDYIVKIDLDDILVMDDSEDVVLNLEDYLNGK